MRPSEVIPSPLLAELIRLNDAHDKWTRLEFLPDRSYRSVFTVETWLKDICGKGIEVLGMAALGTWLRTGPKCFQPTLEQCSALEQVEVNVPYAEYRQPFPAILVELPSNYAPFRCVLCYDDRIGVGSFSLLSRDHLSDIITTVTSDGVGKERIEDALVKFDDCRGLHEEATRALRVAVNSCLALTHYGSASRYLFPKEIQSDSRLAREHSERGARASRRLALAVRVLSFDQEVTLHETRGEASTSDPTGRSVTTHWRRGHWAMQPCGEKNSQRKRIFRKPVMVRADLFVGTDKDTCTTYKG